MRKVLYLLAGVLLAILLGVAYIKFSMPSGGIIPIGEAVEIRSDSPAFGLMISVALVCWVSAFLPLPSWLAVLLSGVIVWIGLAVMCVTGFFVYLNYPSNTLSDGAYSGFWCGIAMVTSRFSSILKYMYREDGSRGF